jgi:choline dehydrogenase-like flavoprotein
LSADYVIIGSGICGALTALKLAKQGASVLILEAGPRVGRAQLLANFRNSTRRGDWMSPYPFSPWAPHPVYAPEDNGYLVQAGPYPYPAEYIRMVGGTTWHWAAHAWRYVPNDMRIKSLYDVGVDWPFDYDVLEPYYQQAEEIMGVAGAQEEHPESPRKKPFPLEPVAEPWAMLRLRERLAGVYPVVGNYRGAQQSHLRWPPGLLRQQQLSADLPGGCAVSRWSFRGCCRSGRGQADPKCGGLPPGTRRAGPHRRSAVLRPR